MMKQYVFIHVLFLHSSWRRMALLGIERKQRLVWRPFVALHACQLKADSQNSDAIVSNTVAGFATSLRSESAGMSHYRSITSCRQTQTTPTQANKGLGLPASIRSGGMNWAFCFVFFTASSMTQSMQTRFQNGNATVWPNAKCQTKVDPKVAHPGGDLSMDFRFIGSACPRTCQPTNQRIAVSLFTRRMEEPTWPTGNQC